MVYRALVCVILSITGFVVFAATPDEMEARARLRQYPGGCDEEELRVLETLPEALNKTSFKSIQKEVLGDLVKDEVEESAPESE